MMGKRMFHTLQQKLKFHQNDDQIFVGLILQNLVPKVKTGIVSLSC